MTLKKDDELNLGELNHGNITDALEVVSALKAGKDLARKVKPAFLTEIAHVYHQCYSRLEDGGVMVLVLRDYRRQNRRVDLLGDTIDLCRAIGFRYYDRFVAMQSPVELSREEIIVKPLGSSSFWTLYNAKQSDPPWMIPVFEDVLVMTKDRPKRKK